MTFVEIPEEFVTQTQEMDPQTEDVIRGSELRHGMVVVIEGTLMREATPDENSHALRVSRFTAQNRWCRVTDLLVQNDIVSFVGVYSDGVKIPRTYANSWFWVVKNASK